MPERPQKALLFLLSSTLRLHPTTTHLDSIFRASDRSSLPCYKEILISPPTSTLPIPLLRAVYRERPSLCPSKTSRPSVSRFATPLLFPDPGCCPPPRGYLVLADREQLERHSIVGTRNVWMVARVCGYQDTWGIVFVGFVPTWICAAFSRWRGRLITRLTRVSLQTPSPKLTKIPARPSSLKIISIYGFNVRSIPPSHTAIALMRPPSPLALSKHMTNELFLYRAQWS